MGDRSRYSWAYRKRRAALKAHHRDLDTPCQAAGCNGPIWYDGPARHPLSFSVDHIVPLSKGGHETDPRNLAPMHYGCNASKRDRRAASQRPTPTRRSSADELLEW